MAIVDTIDNATTVEIRPISRSLSFLLIVIWSKFLDVNVIVSVKVDENISSVVVSVNVWRVVDIEVVTEETGVVVVVV